MLVFLVPLVNQPDGMDPLFLKQELCQILTFLMAALWLWRCFQTGKIEWAYSKALWPLGALVLWTALTAVLSPYSQVSWDYWKNWICFPLLYFLFTLVCLELWRAENILIVFMAATLVSSLTGVTQRMGLSSGVWLDMVRANYSGRVIAGMGNPDFFAGFLLLAWPLALALYFRALQPATKALWMMVTVFTLGALFLTQSKGGLLGLGAGLAIFLILFILKTKPEGEGKNKRQLISILIGGIFLTGIYPAIQILKPLANPQNSSILFREQLWSGVWKMILDHPLTGVGLGAFSAAFPAYRPLSLILGQSERSYEVNEAHNWVLSWLSQTGWVGLGLVLTFGALVLYQWWRLYQAKAIPPALGAGAFAAFGGIAVDNLFDLNHTLPSTLVPFLFLSALPVALSQRFYRMAGFPIQAKEVKLAGIRSLWFVLSLMATGLCFFQIWKSFEEQWADVQLKTAVRLSQAKQWNEALKSYDKTLLFDPNNVMALYFRGSVYAGLGGEGDNEKALADFNEVTGMEPDYVLVHFKKAQVLRNLGRTSDSEMEMKRAIALDPQVVGQLPEYQEARTRVNEKHYQDALMIYQKLVFDYPTCVPALVDEANCLFLLGKKSEAHSVYQQALRLDPENDQAKQNLQQLFQKS